MLWNQEDPKLADQRLGHFLFPCIVQTTNIAGSHMTVIRLPVLCAQNWNWVRIHSPFGLSSYLAHAWAFMNQFDDLHFFQHLRISYE